MLLVEEGWHSTMYLATALEDAGYAVHVLTANGTSARHRQRTIEWSSGPAITSDRFLSHLDHMIAEIPFAHVLPLTEAAMYRLWDASGSWTERLHPHTVRRAAHESQQCEPVVVIYLCIVVKLAACLWGWCMHR